MQKTILTCMAIVLMNATGLFAVEADIDGATPGKWTMDLDAAKKMAAEKKLPILLDFSGSDWCGWCKLMETNVFMKAEWKDYASSNVMMVLLDFPQDDSLVPEKYRARNAALNEKYNIEGFPTFVVLDDDGESELGRLQAGRDKTPASFIAELKQLLRSRSVEIERFMQSLDAEKRAAYDALASKLTETEKRLDAQIAIAREAEANMQELRKAVVDLEQEMLLFRLEQELSPEQFEAYKEIKGKYDAAIQEMEDWLATNPGNTEENVKLFETMRDTIMSLQEKLSAF